MSIPEACDSPDFKSWLVVKLEPLCDADPEVMAEYIVALLKHDMNLTEDQWKDYVANDLTDFLEANSRPFVDELFTTIRSRTYLSAQPTVVSTFQPNPQTKVLTPAAIASTPIIQSELKPTSNAALPTASSAGGGLGTRHFPPASAGPSSRRNEQGEMNFIHNIQGQRREPCRDYHERGFCLRGSNCPYEHSDDVIIPSAEMMFGMPQLNGGASGLMGHDPGVDGGRGRGRGRGGPGRGRGRGGRGESGGGFGPSGSVGDQFQNQGGQIPMGFPQGMMGIDMGMGMGIGMGGMPIGMSMMVPSGPQQGQSFQPYYGTGSSRPPPIPDEFQGVNRPPSDRNGTTILLTDVPPTFLTIPAIKDYFSQFGQVTNIAIEGRSRRALVSFSTNREAYAAWKSDEAVFGSRHVKVLWHRPRPGQGGAGQKALDASASLIANMKESEDGNGNDSSKLNNGVIPQLEGPESRLKKTLAELEAKEKRSKKETLIAEQKVLLARASGNTVSKEEKVTILNRLKVLAKEMEELDKPSTLGGVEGVEIGEGDVEMSAGEGAEQDELFKLSAQLSALRDKATTLGISSHRYSPYSRGSSRRGRGSSRGSRGGSGAVRGPMRLDNRSKTVLVTGDALTLVRGSEAIREWYEHTGGKVESVPGDGQGFIVSYPSREMAEKALALGTKEIPGLEGEIHAAWDTSTMKAAGGGSGSDSAEFQGFGSGDRLDGGEDDDQGEVEMGDEGEHERRDE